MGKTAYDHFRKAFHHKTIVLHVYFLITLIMFSAKYFFREHMISEFWHGHSAHIRNPQIKITISQMPYLSFTTLFPHSQLLNNNIQHAKLGKH